MPHLAVGEFGLSPSGLRMCKNHVAAQTACLACLVAPREGFEREDMRVPESCEPMSGLTNAEPGRYCLRSSKTMPSRKSRGWQAEAVVASKRYSMPHSLRAFR